MPNLTRSIAPAPTRAGAPSTRTKLLLVRTAGPPVKSVRRSDEPNRLPLRLLIATLAVIGTLGATWLLGFLGFRLGFAPLMRAPDLMCEGGNGLATGALMIVAIPRLILQAGLTQPGWLIIGFLVIAIPAAGLSAVKPGSPGGPKPKFQAVAASYAGAVGVMVNGVALLAWTASPLRWGLIRELPDDAAEAQTWVADLETVAGLDVLALITAVLWVILALRLAIPLWLKALAGATGVFALIVISVAMATTTAAAAQVKSGRSVFFLDDGSLQLHLVLGFTPRSIATISVMGGATFVDLRDRPSVLRIVGRQSIVDFLEDQSPDHEE